MNKNRIFKQVDDCMLEDMDGELLVYNPANATTLHLNGPSAIIWQLLDGENSVGQLVEALQEAFPDQADQIEADVFATIKELKEREVIALVEG